MRDLVGAGLIVLIVFATFAGLWCIEANKAEKKEEETK